MRTWKGLLRRAVDDDDDWLYEKRSKVVEFVLEL